MITLLPAGNDLDARRWETATRSSMPSSRTSPRTIDVDGVDLLCCSSHRLTCVTPGFLGVDLHLVLGQRRDVEQVGVVDLGRGILLVHASGCGWC